MEYINGNNSEDSLAKTVSSLLYLLEFLTYLKNALFYMRTLTPRVS